MCSVILKRKVITIKSLFSNCSLVPFILLLSVCVKAQTLCTSTENSYFDCETKNGKQVSVCGSKDLSKTVGYLQYRFGNSEKIELEFPLEKKESSKKFFYTHYFRPQTDYTNLSFTNSGVEYSVFHSYIGDEKPIVNEWGVTIGVKGKDHRVFCKTQPKQSLDDLKGFVSCDKDDALSLGSCP